MLKTRLDLRPVCSLCSAACRLPPRLYDRAVALVCTMRTLCGRWLHVRCRCEHTTPNPVRLMLQEQPECAGQSLADVLARLRCCGCQGRGRLMVHLCEDAYGVGSLRQSIAPEWALLLCDGLGWSAGRIRSRLDTWRISGSEFCLHGTHGDGSQMLYGSYHESRFPSGLRRWLRWRA